MNLTKRMLLSFVMSQYDPMGLICPLMIILKIMLRSLYGPGCDVGWDEPIPDYLHAAWVEVLTMFVQLGEIMFDRAVKPEGTVGAPELIGFADGSLDAYACVVYVRWLLKKTNVEDPDRFYVHLVCGKARVTPVKGTTVPRSELSRFLILKRLLKVVVNSMDEKPYQITTALDSQCTISAFERSGGSLATYFASRVSEASSNLADLGEHSVVQPIMYVPGDLNPADLPTKANTRKFG